MSETIAAFHAVRFTLLFTESEDRLFLLAFDANGAQVGLMLTRRLTARLINGLANLLERSNVAASTAPEELKSDIVLMEHQGALAETKTLASSSGSQQQTNTLAGTGSTKVTQRLVTTVNIKTNPKDFHIVLQAPDGVPVATAMNRFDLHRFVELLKRQAETAGWNLQIDAAWLDDDHSQFTVN